MDAIGLSYHQPHDCLLNRLYRRRSKKTSKLRVTGLCTGNSPVTGEFPTQMASNAENVSIWWRQHDPGLIQLHFQMGWFCWVFTVVSEQFSSLNGACRLNLRHRCGRCVFMSSLFQTCGEILPSHIYQYDYKIHKIHKLLLAIKIIAIQILEVLKVHCISFLFLSFFNVKLSRATLTWVVNLHDDVIKLETQTTKKKPS